MSDDDVYDVEAIKARRMVGTRTEYLVKWKGYEEESWEPSYNILDKNLIKEFRKESKRKKRNRRKKVEVENAAPESIVNGDDGEEEVKENESDEIKKTMPDLISDIQDPEVSSGGDIVKEKPRLLPTVCESKLSKDEVDVDLKSSVDMKKENEIPIEELSDVQEIIGATEINGQIYFLIKWRDENKEMEPMCSTEANVKYPREVIAFYERHFEWVSD